MLTRPTCSMYYIWCANRSKDEDTSKLYGRTHHYFRCFCDSGGMYDNHPCIHAFVNGSRLVPRSKRRIIRNPVVKVFRTEPSYPDIKVAI